MRKKPVNICLVLITAVFFSVLLSPVQAQEYKTFRLCTQKIDDVGISQTGIPLDPMAVLQLPGSSSKEQGIKNAALAMAIGYCTFLELTKLPDDLKAAGADAKLVDEIMRGENVNQWLATAWQESKFDVATTTQSGYYQIDNPPAQVVENMHWIWVDGEEPDWKRHAKFYYPFMDNFETAQTKRELAGGTDYNLLDKNRWWKGKESKTYEENMPPLTRADERGFVWSSVEKGYYEAITYIKNKNGAMPFCNADGDKTQPADYKPYPGFNLAAWAVKYAAIPETTYPYPVVVDGKKYEAPGKLKAYNGLGMVMAYMYNRGQHPFINYYCQLTKEDIENIIDRGKKAGKSPEEIQKEIDAQQAGLAKVRKACQYITDAFGKSAEDVPALKDSCRYMPDGGDPADPLWWGGRYIWQLGWVNATLNERSEVYQEKITLEDVLSALNVLKGFYSHGNMDSDTAVEKGIAKAKGSTWGHAYNSPETFEGILAVTKAMMEESRFKEAKQPDDWPKLR